MATEDFLNKSSRSVQPRRHGKKRPFNEGGDHQRQRHERINFKRYVEELEQDDQDDGDEVY